MSFDFDTPPPRAGTDSQKWQKYAGRDVLPLWVADMDFRSPPAVIEALKRRAEDGVFGYARPVKSTIEAVVHAMERNYGWRIQPDWLVWLPGLVTGLNLISETYAQPGEEVLCLTPVYPPFLLAPRYRGRTSVPVPLALSTSSRTRPLDPVDPLSSTPSRARLLSERGRVREDVDARWEINWEALEKAITPKTRLFFLCHPHNPVARVWERPELERLADFCARHKLILCSDEIHCDLVLDPARRHIPAATVSPEAAARTVTLMAPSKTYNVPGLGTSFAIISDPALRAQLVKAALGIIPEVTALGYTACEAAYRDGEPWRLALLACLRGNRDFLVDFVQRDLPGVKIEAPIGATYLAWLNVEALGLADPIAHFEGRGVGLSDGTPFGAKAGKHVRLNFGCPRSTLVEALKRMAGS